MTSDEGIELVIRHRAFSPLDWSGVMRVGEDRRPAGDGTFTRQRFYPHARWREQAGQFGVFPTDDSGRPIGTPVEAPQVLHGLVLGCGSDVSMHGQVRQERCDPGIGGEEVVVRPLAVTMDESDDPLPREALGVDGIMVQTEHRSHVMEACGLWISRRVRPMTPPWGALRSLITSLGQKCPKTSPISDYQGKKEVIRIANRG